MIGTLSRRLAEKLYSMFDLSRADRVTHAFDRINEHMLIVGEGSGIDVLFVDWGRNYSCVDKNDRPEKLKGHLRCLISEISSRLCARASLSGSGNSATARCACCMRWLKG